MSLSVVIPAYNESANIGRCLRAIRGFSVAVDSITVVDNGSSDRTAEIARSLGANVLHEPVRGRGRARNRGWRASHSDWVAFIDADCAVAPDWAERLLARSQLLRCAVAQGPILPASETASLLLSFRQFRLAQKTQGTLSHLSTIGRNTPVLNGAAFIVKRSALEAVGGFDESLPRHQDVDLGMRLFHHGADVCFVPTARAQVFFSTGWLSYFARSFDVGVQRARFSAKWNRSGPQPSQLSDGLQRYVTRLWNDGDLNWLLMAIDETLVFCGEFLHNKISVSTHAPGPTSSPAHLLLGDRTVTRARGRWLELDALSGHVLRYRQQKLTFSQLVRIAEDLDPSQRFDAALLEAYEAALAETFSGDLS